MKIAVLLSSYNGEKYINEQIDSIVAQEGDFELDLWVRDDGSSDNTHQILQEYADRNLLRWYTGENLRTAKSFINLLHTCGDYDYYAFSDQDDFWKPDKLLRAINKLKDQSQPAMYFSNAEMVDSDLNNLGRSVYETKPTVEFFSFICSGGVLGCASVFNKKLAEILKKREISEAVIMHDFYVASVCLAVNGTIIYDDYQSLKYRQHGDNVIGMPKGIRATIKNRLGVIFTKRDQSISRQSQEILDNFSEEITDSEKLRWLDKVAHYKDSFWKRISLALSRRTKYKNLNSAVTIRLAILMGNR